MFDTSAFQRAALERLRSRAGIGGAGMGMYGANPNLLALNREHQDAVTAEEGAGAYVGNLNARRDEAFGGSEAVINRNVSRALNLAGLGSQTAGQAGQNLANFRPAPSLWSQLAMAGIQGAAGIAAGAATGGFSQGGRWNR